MDTQTRRWGGRRAGAGRKPSSNVRISLSVPREVWSALQVLAQGEGATPEAVAARWLTERVDQQSDAEQRP